MVETLAPICGMKDHCGKGGEETVTRPSHERDEQHSSLAAKDAFKDWSATNHGIRKDRISRYQDLLLKAIKIPFHVNIYKTPFPSVPSTI